MDNLITEELEEIVELKEIEQSEDKDTFEFISVKRGFTEIQNIYEELEIYKCFFCGGYVRYMGSPLISPPVASDLDIYCLNNEEFLKVRDHLKNLKFKIKHENDLAVTYFSHKEEQFRFCPPLQLIKPVKEGRIVGFGEMKEVLMNFDFSVIRCGLATPRKILADSNFMEDEESLRLRLKNIHCPISSTLRCMKYSKKGYYIKPKETLKLFLDWDSRNQFYKMKIIDFFDKLKVTQSEIDELEKLIRVD